MQNISVAQAASSDHGPLHLVACRGTLQSMGFISGMYSGLDSYRMLQKSYKSLRKHLVKIRLHVAAYHV